MAQFRELYEWLQTPTYEELINALYERFTQLNRLIPLSDEYTDSDHNRILIINGSSYPPYNHKKHPNLYKQPVSLTQENIKQSYYYWYQLCGGWFWFICCNTGWLIGGYLSYRTFLDKRHLLY